MCIGPVASKAPNSELKPFVGRRRISLGRRFGHWLGPFWGSRLGWAAVSASVDVRAQRLRAVPRARWPPKWVAVRS